MHKRILLKLSGEALSGEKDFGIDIEKVVEVAREIKEGHKKVKEIAIVVGGGNIWRGHNGAQYGFDRVDSDNIGMMATVINALALKDALVSIGVQCIVQTAISMPDITSPYIREKALNFIKRGIVVIFAGGTGNPYFSTDTAASLRAAEIKAEVILAAKNQVDGVYKKDPKIYEDAEKIEKLTYKEMLEYELNVMDLTSATLSNENNIDTIVFSMTEKGNITKAICGEIKGSVIKAENKKGKNCGRIKYS